MTVNQISLKNWLPNMTSLFVSDKICNEIYEEIGSLKLMARIGWGVENKVNTSAT